MINYIQSICLGLDNTDIEQYLPFPPLPLLLYEFDCIRDKIRLPLGIFMP